MNIRMSTYSSKKVTYDILNGLKIQLDIEENPYELPLEKLFLMAARINKKRSFLFVSKVLGKHLPIRPATGILTGFLLAARYLEVVHGRKTTDVPLLIEQFIKEECPCKPAPFISDNIQPIVIGFAETATALGHAFFEAFCHADFFHTTREQLESRQETITFEEEHSHATSHRVYVHESLLNNEREIILVDDELTTGKTTLNIIRSLHEKYPRRNYTIVSILDWRSQEHRNEFFKLEKELGIKIHTVSLIKGKVSVLQEMSLFTEDNEVNEFEFTSQQVSIHRLSIPSPIKEKVLGHEVVYSSWTGRFGLTTVENEQYKAIVAKMGELLRTKRTGRRSLVLGTGEFIYIPMKLAFYMGEDVYYQSTTRSPIYPFNNENYGAKNRFSFPNPEDITVQHFLYNIREREYDEIFLVFERMIEEHALTGLLNQLKQAKIPHIQVITFVEEAGEVDGV